MRENRRQRTKELILMSRGCHIKNGLERFRRSGIPLERKNGDMTRHTLAIAFVCTAQAACTQSSQAAPLRLGTTTTVEQSGALALLRSEEHTSELQSRLHLVCRLLLEKKKKK